MLQPTPGAARPPLPPRLGFDVHVLPDPHHTDTVGLHLVGDTAYSLAGFRGQMTAAEVAQTQAADPAKVIGEPDIRDMRDKPWSAIDNKSSKDPDQVSFAERLPDGSTRVYVAAADVDGLVSQNSPLDQRAMDNMTTIYTDLQDYTMLPTDFCQDKTVLLQGKDRAALVTEFVVTPQGDVKDAKIYRADVNNHCQLNYDEVDQWFGDHQQVPPTMAGQAAMAEQLNLQDEASQWIEHGEVQKGRPPAHAPKGAEHSGEAMRLVEMQMRTVNRVTANYLLTHGFPAIVKTRDVTPQNWAKIRALAPNLPEVPDNVALQGFMDDQKKLGADHFQQLQKQVSTLLGRPRDTVAVPGHEHELFNMGSPLSARMTGPNRLEGDLVNQRMVKALLDGQTCPYQIGDPVAPDALLPDLKTSTATLHEIAEKSNRIEKACYDVMRQVQNSMAAFSLQEQIHRVFAGKVTGQTGGGSFVELPDVGSDGYVHQKLDKGQKVSVSVDSVDIEKGRIALSVVPSQGSENR